MHHICPAARIPRAAFPHYALAPWHTAFILDKPHPMKPLCACLLLLSLLCSSSPHAAEEPGTQGIEAITALRDVGRFAEAEKAARALVAARTQALGAQDQETLRARILLTQLLGAHSSEAEAEAQLRELLPVVSKVFGEQQRDTLVCQTTFIDALASQNKTAEAADLCRTCLPIETQVLGPADPETLKTRRLYATILSQLGKGTEAAEEQRAVLDLCLRTLGPEAKETLRTRMALAAAESQMGRPAEAEPELRGLLPLCSKVFGAEHFETQTCIHVLIKALRAQEKYAEAVEERRRWLVIATRVYGPENSATLDLRSEQAADLDSQDRYAEAEQERRGILAIQERTLGTEDKATLKTCHLLALSLKKQKKTAEALAYARLALAGQTRLLGKDANDTDASQRLVNQLSYASPQGLPKPADANDRPVAMVDGTLVLASEVQKTAAAQEKVIRYQYRNDSDKMEEELAGLNHSTLSGLIDRSLLLNEFRRIGGILKPEHVDNDLNTLIKDSFKGSRDRFMAELSENGVTLEEFRTLRKNMIIMNVMRFRFAGEITLTDEELRDYFEKNKQRWLAPEKLKIRTISIPNTQADARKTAESLRKKILAGADFAETARASSQDSHADEGGAWGWTLLTDLSDHVRKTAAKTPKGQVGELIEQEGTFIILRVDDRRVPALPAFEKVKSEVTEALGEEKSRERIEQQLGKLREKADIQMMESL